MRRPAAEALHRAARVHCRGGRAPWSGGRNCRHAAPHSARERAVVEPGTVRDPAAPNRELGVCASEGPGGHDGVERHALVGGDEHFLRERARVLVKVPPRAAGAEVDDDEPVPALCAAAVGDVCHALARGRGETWKEVEADVVQGCLWVRESRREDDGLERGEHILSSWPWKIGIQPAHRRGAKRTSEMQGLVNVKRVYRTDQTHLRQRTRMVALRGESRSLEAERFFGPAKG
jgi:hypothetical protein